MRNIMITRTSALAPALFVLAWLAMPAAARQDDEALKKDLTAVIALHGQPCGEVVSVTVLKQNDYAATCKDGNKYHVFENDKGRIVVEKQK
jgi:hypothetical protein